MIVGGDGSVHVVPCLSCAAKDAEIARWKANYIEQRQVVKRLSDALRAAADALGESSEIHGRNGILRWQDICERARDAARKAAEEGE